MFQFKQIVQFIVIAVANVPSCTGIRNFCVREPETVV